MKDAFTLKRRVELNKILTENELQQLEAMKNFFLLDSYNVKGKRLTLTYRAVEIQWPMIASELEDMDIIDHNSRLNKFRFAWYKITDANNRDNANAPPPVCCNKPPVQISRSHKI